MSETSLPNPNRQIVRKTTLDDEGVLNDYAGFTPEQRLLMVWPITLTAWKFKDPHGVQQRLQRHVGRVERRER